MPGSETRTISILRRGLALTILCLGLCNAQLTATGAPENRAIKRGNKRERAIKFAENSLTGMVKQGSGKSDLIVDESKVSAVGLQEDEVSHESQFISKPKTTKNEPGASKAEQPRTRKRKKELRGGSNPDKNALTKGTTRGGKATVIRRMTKYVKAKISTPSTRNNEDHRLHTIKPNMKKTRLNPETSAIKIQLKSEPQDEKVTEGALKAKRIPVTRTKHVLNARKKIIEAAKNVAPKANDTAYTQMKNLEKTKKKVRNEVSRQKKPTKDGTHETSPQIRVRVHSKLKRRLVSTKKKRASMAE